MSELKRRNVFRVALFYTVSAWVVVQVAETLLPVFEVPDSAIRAIVLILALGFPLALVFSWVFELTPDGLKLDRNARADAATKRQTERKLNWATLIAAVLAIGLLIADRLMPEPRPEMLADESAASSSDSEVGADREVDAASIAVLPFEDLSPDGDRSYFSDGIAEEVLGVLADVDGLIVASRTSSFQFRGQRAIGIPQIAEILSVRHVLEGSVRTAGDQIRVVVQLIDSVSDQPLWSETYDNQLSTANLFAIQDEIARSIVAAIRDRLGISLESPRAASVGTEDVDAYALFLRARSLFRSRSFFEEAHGLVQRAIELDPQFADALALRAALLTIAPEYGVVFSGTPAESRAQAEVLARRALELDSSQVLAHGILGLIQDFGLYDSAETGRYQRILDQYEAALTISPNDPGVLNWRGFTYLRAGYTEQARADFERCIETEPGYAPCNANLVAALTLDGNDDAALERLDRAIELGVYTGDIPSLANLHQLGLERAFYFHAIRLPSLRGWLGMDEIHDALARPGEDHSALIRRLEAHGELVGSSRSLDELMLALGKYDARPPTFAIWFDSYRAYRQSPQFKEHMRLLGLVEFWTSNGFPAFCRPLGEDDFECD
ncbi:hypothetical protein AY599_00295 [Leptolyngbya valderiana BDU 20041]|nr:hypothetical protein AY599_00295 [Leptolyngbya valderiana BDU 20041]